VGASERIAPVRIFGVLSNIPGGSNSFAGSRRSGERKSYGSITEVCTGPFSINAVLVSTLGIVDALYLLINENKQATEN
jgi:hypothetical protein